MQIIKIISGGQSGVDQGALLAAMNCNVQTGGWCPPGRSCETGRIPEHFNLKETPDERSNMAPDIPRSQRTEWNIRDSDGTLILAPSRYLLSDKGSEWAEKCCMLLGKPFLLTDPADDKCVLHIVDWIKQRRIEILNVAGPPESLWSGAENSAKQIVYKLLSSGLR